MYRATDFDRGNEYLRTHDTAQIATNRPGDFHTSNQKAAYFTTDKEYARNLAGASGMIIRQDIPREMLRQGYKFDDVPSDEWYHVRFCTFDHSMLIDQIALTTVYSW